MNTHDPQTSPCQYSVILTPVDTKNHHCQISHQSFAKLSKTYLECTAQPPLQNMELLMVTMFFLITMCTRDQRCTIQHTHQQDSLVMPELAIPYQFQCFQRERSWSFCYQLESHHSHPFCFFYPFFKNATVLATFGPLY